MSATHTPLPWIIRAALDCRHAFPIIGADETEIAGVNALGTITSGYGKERDDFTRSPEGQPAAIANARLIVTAVNNHAALVAPLANLCDACDGNYAELVAECRAVLAAVGKDAP